jgi:hypothetical protein
MPNLRSLAEAIRIRYHYAKTPSDEEVKKVLNRIAIRKASGNAVGEAELHEIINDCLKDKSVIALDSVDMSPTVSILRQIMTAAEQQQNK